MLTVFVLFLIIFFLKKERTNQRYSSYKKNNGTMKANGAITCLTPAASEVETEAVVEAAEVVVDSVTSVAASVEEPMVLVVMVVA